MLIQFLTSRCSRAALAVLCAAGLSSTSRAQEPRRLATSDSIPVDLASALISSGGIGGDPQILVGALPGWIASRIYIPANARVLGSAFMGQTVVGVLAMADAPEVVIAELKRELPSHGWKTPPAQAYYGGGFRPASLAEALGGSATSLMLCGDQLMLSTSARRQRGTNTVVVVRVSAQNGQYGPCIPQQMPPGMTRSPFPTLFNPAGAAEGSVDCQRNYGSSGTGTQLRTAMSSDSIFGHYAKQLQDSGWKAAPEARIVGRTFTRTDSTGTPLELSLTIASSARDSTCREINMQVRTLRKP